MSDTAGAKDAVELTVGPILSWDVWLARVPNCEKCGEKMVPHDRLGTFKARNIKPRIYCGNERCVQRRKIISFNRW